MLWDSVTEPMTRWTRGRLRKRETISQHHIWWSVCGNWNQATSKNTLTAPEGIVASLHCYGRTRCSCWTRIRSGCSRGLRAVFGHIWTRKIGQSLRFRAWLVLGYLGPRLFRSRCTYIGEKFQVHLYLKFSWQSLFIHRQQNRSPSLLKWVEAPRLKPRQISDLSWELLSPTWILIRATTVEKR